MRPKSIPEFTKRMNELFRLKNGHAYLDTTLMQITGRIELDILKLDDLLHERHGEYERKAKSMSDITIQEYGVMANAFVNSMLGKCQETTP
jgi:hypothetical protein